MASTNSVSYGYINDTISTGISAFESKLRSTMTSMADNTDARSRPPRCCRCSSRSNNGPSW